MATYYTGQRVKIAHPINKKHRNDEGVMIALYEQIEDSRGDLINCQVKWDDGYPNPNTHTSRLEPLQPEGWKMVEWSDCLWSPSEELLNA